MKLPPVDTEQLGGEHTEIEVKQKARCTHDLYYVTAQDARCRLCQMGVYIGLGDYLKNGHLYHGNEKII